MSLPLGERPNRRQAQQFSSGSRHQAFSKRSPLAGTLDQVRPLPIQSALRPRVRRLVGLSSQTPSGGGLAPTPYRSENRRVDDAIGIDQSRPVTEGPLQKARYRRPLPIQSALRPRVRRLVGLSSQTPSGGGLAPTPYRSENRRVDDAIGIDQSRPVTEGPLQKARYRRMGRAHRNPSSFLKRRRRRRRWVSLRSTHHTAYHLNRHFSSTAGRVRMNQL